MSTADLFQLDGKIAVVTGATGRLGQEICWALAEAGAHVVVNARTAQTVSALAEALEAQTSLPALGVAQSAMHEAGVNALFEATTERFGRVDILVNAATGNAPDPADTMSEATWDRAMHDIVGGMFLCCQAAGALMTRDGGGSIINISSMYGEVAADPRIYGDSGFNSSVVYGAGKAAVNQLTRYLATAWAGRGIRVNTLTAGGVEDEANNHAEFRANYQGRTPMGRMMRREEIRGPLVFLASKASSYVTGHNLSVDGGFTVV